MPRTRWPRTQRIVDPVGVVWQLLTRAGGVRYILQRLGGAWRLFAMASRFCPTVLLDRGYDLVATIRHRVFRRPQEACPILPGELRDRFGS